MGNTCCNANETDKNETVEVQRKDIPGAKIDEGAGDDKLPNAASVAQTFLITLDKTGGERLGVDVDHQDGVILGIVYGPAPGRLD